MAAGARTDSTAWPSRACSTPCRASPASCERTTSSAFRRMRWMIRTRFSQSAGMSGLAMRVSWLYMSLKPIASTPGRSSSARPR